MGSDISLQMLVDKISDIALVATLFGLHAAVATGHIAAWFN